jgi:hypothetical protein
LTNPRRSTALLYQPGTTTSTAKSDSAIGTNSAKVKDPSNINHTFDDIYNKAVVAADKIKLRRSAAAAVDSALASSAGITNANRTFDDRRLNPRSDDSRLTKRAAGNYETDESPLMPGRATHCYVCGELRSLNTGNHFKPSKYGCMQAIRNGMRTWS